MATVFVVLGLLTFAALCVGISALVARVRAANVKRPQPRRLLVHSINDDRCTGCDACVTVCPTDVLELVANKSRVERFGDCIQCEQCVTACPTTALVMHFQGTEPPAFRMPELDDYYQAAPGLYLIGEAGGKPLVKNASNLGRAAVEHMLRTGLEKGSSQRIAKEGHVDVLIVGSGPGGLSAALSCIANRLSYVVVEKDELVASTVARYPKGKIVMAEPYDVKCVGLLPVWDTGRDELLAAWRTIIERTGLSVQTRETVEDVQRDLMGEFLVKTSRRTYHARRVVLSIGTRGKPRRLGVPGESLPKVSALLTDADHHRGQRVLVVGGGDSAVEAALALAQTAQRVTLSYRGRQLSRCKAKNRQALDQLVEGRRIALRFGSNVAEIKPDAVVLKTGTDYEQVPNDHVFVCIGGDAPVRWLEKTGVRFNDQPHLFSRGPTDRVVEALIGPQPDTGKAQDGMGVRSVMVDMGSWKAGSRPQRVARAPGRRR
jgi:putative YpdA family bacillithiol system oxidoreductase